ncbi:MAG TPA: universal stress protein [Mycobacteriales bacterium]|nr:universal stress protein [Mycobacteriales bacterium]
MNRPIVAGVDGSPNAVRAACWAADEAARRGAPLVLFNGFGVADALAKPDGSGAGWIEAQGLHGTAVLKEAELVVRRRHPGLEVTLETSVDPPIPVLTERSGQARLVVLGSAGRGAVGDLLAASTGTALAARSRCPVVVVRGTQDRPDLPVVAAVDGGPACDAVLAAAFDEAESREVPLVAVHVDASPPGILRTRRTVDAWAAKFPAVTAHWMVQHDHPRTHLLGQAAGAQLLVAGRRGHRLGRTGRALLHHCGCPLLIVPENGENHASTTR